MLLFLTRDAFWRRSMEERRVGDAPKLFSELKLRFCQNMRGDVGLLFSRGDDWNGDESV